MIRVGCINCLINFRCDEKHAGKQVNCPRCKTLLTIPFPDPPPSAPVQNSSPIVRFEPAPAENAKRAASWRHFLPNTSNRTFIAIMGPLIIAGFIVGMYLPKTGNVKGRNVQQIQEIKKPVEPSTNQIYSRCIEMMVQRLKNPDTAIPSEKGTVKRYHSDNPQWAVSGTVRAENGIGNMITGQWSMDVTWNPQTDELDPYYIKIGEQFVYESPSMRAATIALAYAGGNEFSDLPDQVAKDIRNVQATVDDEIKAQTRRAYSPQWPDDPRRREFRVLLNAKDEWEVTGKIETFDSRPREEISAVVSRDASKVISLKIGDRTLIRDRQPVSNR